MTLAVEAKTLHRAAVSRFSKALFAAALLHGALALFARAHRPELPARTRPNPAELLVELDPPAIPPVPVAAEPVEESAPPGSALPPSRAAREVAARPISPVEQETLSEASPTEPELEASADGDAAAPVARDTPRSPPRKINLGLDGTTFLLGPEERVPTQEKPVARRKVDVQRRLANALAAADVERGLARGGALVGSFQAAVRADGPTRGEAIFQVTVDGEGKVGVVQLVRGDAQAWASAERAIRQQVQKKRVRVPAGSRGLRITYAVQAKVQYPSGRTDGPAVRLDDPSFAPNGFVPRGAFDLADLGAGPQRIVYARVVSEEVL